MSNLNPNVVDLLNANTEPMVNNFNKIVSWLIHGTDSEHKMPDRVLQFLTTVNGVVERNAQLDVQVQQLTADLDKAVTLVEQLSEKVAGFEQTLFMLQETDPKSKRSRAKSSEPTPTVEQAPAPQPTPVQDDVQLTAQAVDVGEVSEVGLAEIGNMMANLIPNSVPTTTAPVMASL